MCAIPSNPGDACRYWLLQVARTENLGGVGPRRLAQIIQRPRLPRITHIHVDEGRAPAASADYHIGVYGKNVLQRQQGFRLKHDYLRTRGIDKHAKVLVLGGKDPFLLALCHSIGEPFFESIAREDITAIICPFLSNYRHCEHRVGLDNRAMGQRFMEALLERGLPGVLFTYLDLGVEQEEWLVGYLQLNPMQELLATGFDHGAANNERFCLERIRMLQKVQERIGRPIRPVLSGILTRLPIIREASSAFPGRVHLLGQSVYLRSVQGSRLAWNSGTKRFAWHERDRAFARGCVLFQHNSRVLEEVLLEQVSEFIVDTEKQDS